MTKKKKSPKKKDALVASVMLFTIALYITLVLFQKQETVLVGKQIREQGGLILGRSYPLSEPDIQKNEGAVVSVEGITAIVEKGTFGNDAYFRVDRTVRGNPVHVQGLWQVTDMWEARLRYMSNDNDIPTIDTRRSYILSFPYTAAHFTTDQGVTFSEDSLKLVRGDSATGPWTILDNAVHDAHNDTFSIVTNRGGFFIISGGFRSSTSTTSTTTSTSTTTTTKAPTKKPTAEPTVIVLQKNEIVVTVTPSPEPDNDGDDTVAVDDGEVNEKDSTEKSSKPLYKRIIDFFFSSLGF